MWCSSRVSHRALIVSSLLLLAATVGHAASITGANSLTVTVSSNGSYSISVPANGWSFTGAIGSSLSNLGAGAGSDGAAGAYSEITFDFRSDAQRHVAIRAYAGTPAVLFTVTMPSGGPNTFSLPTLTGHPAGLSHIAFSGTFGNATFQGTNDESPWVQFDAAGHTMILSPATHFMVARTNTLTNGSLVSGINPKITSLPAGFTQQTLLVVEDGINRAFDTWGNLLTALTGKVRPANDAGLILERLGYWTDAGSTYYYSMEGDLSYPETLQAVRADFDRLGIPLGYLQLDSWFYPKGPAADWKSVGTGIYQYQAATPPFAGSLTAFQQALGVPLITHARWIDPSSPYMSQYRMSGTVSIDPLYWSMVANYLAGSGVVTFEQDWLADKAATAYNLTDGDAFLGNMSSAMGGQNLDIQYCSPTARHFLQSTLYNNVTNIRPSMDRFTRDKWTAFLYTSRLASAVGLWPFTDVFMSGETGNLLLATLSAGPLGIGDRVGTLDEGNLRQAVRGDGVIVKPDVPLTPVDSSFWNDSQNLQAPMLAATYTDFGALRAWYLLLYSQNGATEAQFRLSDAGIHQPVFLYDYATRAGALVQPDDWLAADVADYEYKIAVPVGPSGIAVLGDLGQFVSLGKKRIAELTDDGVVRLTVAFAGGESSRTISGYSLKRPSAVAVSGSLTPLRYDSLTGRFTLKVSPGSEGTASIEISPRPERQQPLPRVRK